MRREENKIRQKKRKQKRRKENNIGQMKREQKSTRENRREQERTEENKREQKRTRENRREQERTGILTKSAVLWKEFSQSSSLAKRYVEVLWISYFSLSGIKEAA